MMLAYLHEKNGKLEASVEAPAIRAILKAHKADGYSHLCEALIWLGTEVRAIWQEMKTEDAEMAEALKVNGVDRVETQSGDSAGNAG